MSLLVETTVYDALPADIVQAITNAEGGYQVPCHVSQTLDHYTGITCGLCGKPIPEHVWFASDGNDRVLRCSITEGRRRP